MAVRPETYTLAMQWAVRIFVGVVTFVVAYTVGGSIGWAVVAMLFAGVIVNVLASAIHHGSPHLPG